MTTVSKILMRGSDESFGEIKVKCGKEQTAVTPTGVKQKSFVREEMGLILVILAGSHYEVFF